MGALALVLGLGATAIARADETLTIGSVTTLTGPGAPWGLGAAGGVQIAVDDVNAAGGLKIGGTVYKVKLISYDEPNAAAALGAYDRLVTQDHVKFILGPTSSVGALAIKSRVEQDKVLIFTAAYSRKTIDKDTKYAYRLISTPTEIGDPLSKWLKARLPNAHNVAILNPNDETGRDTGDVLKAAYARNGFTVVDSELFESSVKDFQPMLIKVLALKPDVIELASSAPPIAGLIVRQARDLGYTGTFMKIGGPGAMDIVNAAGAQAAEGVLNYLYADPANAGYKHVAEAYQKKNGYPPNDIVIPFYDATRVLLAAIEKSGSIDDTDKVRAEIPGVMPYNSVLGEPLKLTGKDNYGVNNQILSIDYVGQIEKGKTVILGQAD